MRKFSDYLNEGRNELLNELSDKTIVSAYRKKYPDAKLSDKEIVKNLKMITKTMGSYRRGQSVVDAIKKSRPELWLIGTQQDAIRKLVGSVDKTKLDSILDELNRIEGEIDLLFKEYKENVMKIEKLIGTNYVRE